MYVLWAMLQHLCKKGKYLPRLPNIIAYQYLICFRYLQNVQKHGSKSPLGICILALRQLPNASKHVRLFVCPSIFVPNNLASVVIILTFAKTKISPMVCLFVVFLSAHKLQHIQHINFHVYPENRKKQTRPSIIMQHENLFLYLM